jgi:DGQHR domain-containing protein
MSLTVKRPVLKVNALRIEQRKDIPIYVFGIDGRLVHQLATVSFANRTKDGALVGYQRNEVTSHIRSILNYLSQGQPLLPNAIVIAFDERVKFSKLNGAMPSEWGTFGTLEIPLPRSLAETKVGWIVDGQQRVTALAQLNPKAHFPVVVVAFQSSSQKLQREQFLLVNKTKPLPRDLINEILPDVTAPLSKDLESRRVASKVVQLLRFDTTSPFYCRIRGLGGYGEDCNISQAALISVIQNSIRKKGVLFDLSDAKGRHDFEGMARVVSTFFEGVRRTWPEAWDESPKTSRLVHGVGIVAMGYLMDRVMQEVDTGSHRAASMVANRLTRLRVRCAWTSGRWPVLGCMWNELQNTSQDKARLTEFLLKEYKRRVV